MAIFNRKPKNPSALPEVDQYYSAERRERSGLAWVLALASVALVALVIIGLFFGGRWAYRKIADNDKKNIATQTDNSGSFDGAFDSDKGDDSDESDDTAKPTPAPTPQTTPTPAPSTPPATTPATGDGPLPNTGPGSTVAIFVAVSAVAGAAHHVVSRRRASR